MMRVLPAPADFISAKSPLRKPVSFSITTPEYSSSTSTVTSSMGSRRWPSSSLNKTRGRLIDSSNPSRRMFSIRTPICNSPRPATSKASPLGVSVTRIATLVSASSIKRLRITRLCTFLPSRPARGLSLIPKVTDMVGGSIGKEGRASLISGAQMVSATVALVMPASDTISPATASSIAVCDRPRNARIFVQRNCSILLPSRDRAFTESPALRRPVSTRPVRMRPMNGSAPSVVASMEKGSWAFSACLGDCTWRTINSNKAERSLRGPSSSSSAQPARPEA